MISAGQAPAPQPCPQIEALGTERGKGFPAGVNGINRTPPGCPSGAQMLKSEARGNRSLEELEGGPSVGV